MRQNESISRGFTSLGVLSVALVVVIIGAIGLLAVSHENNNTKKTPASLSVQHKTTTYSYAGYVFPYLPNIFIESSKTNSGPYPSVSYTSTSPLSQIENSLTSVCKDYKYAVEGSFETITNNAGEKNATKSYEMSCDTIAKSNQWEFNISTDASKTTDYDISVMSMPVLTGGSAAAR